MSAIRNDSLEGAVTGPFSKAVEQLIRGIRRVEDGQKTFFDTSLFTWAQELESQWLIIRSELDRLLTALDLLPGFEEIQAEQFHLTKDKRWKVFPLYAYGHWLEKNEKRCPQTAKAIRKIPGLQAAMFSILQAQKELPPHTGNYCGVLRYHLALKIPKPETLCGIRVGEDTVHWTEGKSIIFDDTHLHSAWNRSGEDRVVLFVDFTRPLPSPLREPNDRVIDAIGKSGFIENANHRWETWENTFGEKLDRLLSTL
jgi:beta-hydroxylase